MTDPRPTWAVRGSANAVEKGDAFAPHFDADGLIPAICTDVHTREILMVAWMNADALTLSLSTGYAHFWTRSRKRIWMKGEESGNRLAVRRAWTDCDQDVLHLEVEIEGDGVACHTGARSCFYRELDLEAARRGGPVKLRSS
jgi:phosphoribosyl-AMP cyclohydrolase